MVLILLDSDASTFLLRPTSRPPRYLVLAFALILAESSRSSYPLRRAKIPRSPASEIALIKPQSSEAPQGTDV
ncbi:hypothetical protein K523DRAFT_320039 [Schizophyllum commune Tattone D]|nr:hypothetical protein K523DRAFT_320039 [Schizophyllum commune Tattone D]